MLSQEFCLDMRSVWEVQGEDERYAVRCTDLKFIKESWATDTRLEVSMYAWWSVDMHDISRVQGLNREELRLEP